MGKYISKPSRILLTVEKLARAVIVVGQDVPLSEQFTAQELRRCIQSSK